MKLKRGAMLAGAVASTAVLALGTATGASATTGGHLWNNSPSVNECMAAAGNTTGRVIMWSCDAEAGQQWHLEFHQTGTSGYYNIVNGNYDCLDASYPGNGAQLYAEPCSGSSTQTWDLHGVYPYTISDIYGLCVSVAYGSTANGANVIHWTCQNTPDQEWSGPGFN